MLRDVSRVSRKVLPFDSPGRALALLIDAGIGEGARDLFVVLLMFGLEAEDGGREKLKGRGFIMDFGGAGASSTKS